MEEANLTRSMSKKGCSPDNSACEGFFGHLKAEMFYGHDWDEYSIEEFIQEINGYMSWYCKDRIKSTLGGLSPDEVYHRAAGCSQWDAHNPFFLPGIFLSDKMDLSVPV